jgi:hypothetical protein
MKPESRIAEYRGQRWLALVWLVIVGGQLWQFLDQERELQPVFAAVVIAAGLPIIATNLRALVAIGREGVTIRSALKSETIGLGSVKGFAFSPARSLGWGLPAFLETTDGRAIRIPQVQLPRLVRSAGKRNVRLQMFVAQLNSDLEDARATDPPTQ